MALELDDKNFDSEVMVNDAVVLVDFWAPWCGPCQMMVPVIDELAKEMAGVAKIGKLNVDDNPEKASQFGIMSLPTIKIFKGGVVVKEFIGVQRKDILKGELEKIK